jgi:acyl-CoA synthetase (AMP-forming)/AMP-acid ligase II
MSSNLQLQLRHQLERSTDRKIIGWYDAAGVCTWRTGGELLQQIGVATARLAEAGLRPGDACVIVLPSEQNAGIAFLGALFAGAQPLLVAPPTLQRFNPDLVRVLLHTIKRTRARIVVHGDSLADVTGDVGRSARGARLIAASELRGSTTEPLPRLPQPHSDDVVAMQLTSGTTGLPRIGLWSHRGVLAALDGMAAAMHLRDGDVCFNWTPLYHDMGLVNNFLLCLVKGVPLVMQKPQDFVKRPASWLRGLAETGATLTWAPNFGFALATERVRDAELQGVRLERVRAFWNAAERVHFETIEGFARRFSAVGVRREALKTNFGCVENVGGATFSDVGGAIEVERVDVHALQSQRIALPAIGAEQALTVVGVGRPNPGIEIAILSPRGRTLADGRVGEIALRTPSRMLGYLGDAEATRRALYGDWLRTGDLGYLHNGSLFWVGRVRERITVRGKKIDPSEFEPILFAISGLRAGCFAAFGVDERDQGTQRIVVVAEVREPLERDPKAISTEIREQSFRKLDVAVSEVVLVAPGTLAKTSSGKRRHRHFRRLYLENKLAGLDPDSTEADHVAM